jgi:transcriptional regulator with XRE-family HTH domain
VRGAEEDEAGRRLARRLAGARERLGISARELSRRVGIPLATISALEGGRDPKWSTLVRYLETVPGLRAQHLVGGSRLHPPAASRSLTDALRRIAGQRAESVSVEVRRGTLTTRVEALSTDLPAKTPERTILLLMQLACTGSQQLLASLEAPKGRARTSRVLEGGVRHEFRAAPGPSVAYRRVERPAPAPECIAHEAGYPMGSLTLTAEVPAGAEPRLLAWPISRRVEGASAEISACLYSGPQRPVLKRRGRTVSVTLTDVLPGLVHALDWSASPPAGDPGLAPLPGTGFGPIARALRERSGRSLRSLADAMKVSHVTISEAERGRDPRASTLRRYVATMPDVAPQWILPAKEARGELTQEETWEALRDLHGLEAEADEWLFLVEPDGNRDEIRTLTSLRSVGAPHRGIAMSSLHGRDVHAKAHYDVRMVGAGSEKDEELLVARHMKADRGRPQQIVSVAAELLARGVTLRTTFRPDKPYLMTKAAAVAKHGDKRVVQGITAMPQVPVRRLRCAVRFPSGFRFEDAWAVSQPFDRPSSPEPIGVLERAHAGRWQLRVSRDPPELALDVELPLYGLKYGIGWTL